MKKIKYFIGIIIILLSLFLNYFNSDSNKIDAIYDHAIDGDTAIFRVDGEKIKVRFLAINTPEREEAYYEEAKKALDDILSNSKKIELEKDPKADVDDYGRYLYWVYADDELVNELMVEKGYAEVFFVYDDYLYVDELYEVQDKAKANKLGIWSIE